MRPNRKLAGWLTGWALLGLVPVWWPAALNPWLALGIGLGVLVLLDALELYRQPPPQGQRSVAGVLPLGVWSPVELSLYNPGHRTLTVQVFDHHPPQAQSRHLPRTLTLPPRETVICPYPLRPLARGEKEFGPIQLWLHSRLGVWRRNLTTGSGQRLRVLPDFARLQHQGNLSAEQRAVQMGIHKRRRRGEGQEFHQLRDYREGDSLRQIDWKATARVHRLIARDYQEERDQKLVVLLDCGRRLRARDGELTHFDHALNGVILLAHTALSQGDGVGVQSFAGQDRWLPPRKGPAALRALIDGLYDLEPTLQAPDFWAAAGRLMTRQRRRALVVVVTDLRDEDIDELLPALNLLRQRHLVMVASLREEALDRVLTEPVESFDQARLYGATCHYLEARDRTREALTARGGIVVDALPRQLPVALVNEYLAIKRSGRL